MSTWRMVRVASTEGLSAGNAPAEVRRRSVTEGAAGVALDAGLVRLHQAAIPAAARPEHLKAGMRVAAWGDGGQGSAPGLQPRTPMVAAAQVGHGRLQGGHARFEVVGGALGRRGAELPEHLTAELVDARVVHG